MFYIKTNDGVKLAVYDWNSKAKNTVFLVHGWPLNHKMYEYQIERLIQCGYRVVALDLRGFGASDVPACGYSYDRMAQDIYQVVCALRLQSFALVGFSMGGAIVLRYMRRYRGYGVKKLILLAAAAPIWSQRPEYPYGISAQSVEQMLELAKTDRPKLAENFSEQLFASPQSEAAMHWFRDIALSASGIGTIQALCSLRDEDGFPDLKAVRVPTAIIYGEKDQVVTKDLIRIQHEEIADSCLYTLENSGHGIIYDELERFLEIFLCALE